MAETADLSFDVPGDVVSENVAKQICRTVRDLCGWRKASFPGSQPVSLIKNSLEFLLRNPYLACEKTDGIRLMLFSVKDNVYLIDRNEKVNSVFIHLPSKHNLNENHHVTLLDGELVLDEVEKPDDDDIKPSNVIFKSTKGKLRYLIYDAVVIQQCQSIKEMNLISRLAHVYIEVIKPLIEYDKQKKLKHPGFKEDLRPFEIFLKDYFEVWDIDQIRKYSTKLQHKSDGIIFTPIRLPYFPGTCKQLLKWKPPHLNTVDFSTDIIYDDNRVPRLVQLFLNKEGFNVFMGHFCAPYGDVYKDILQRAAHGAASGLIVECYWVPWEPVKTFLPNLKKQDSSAHKNSNQRQFDLKPKYDLSSGTWVLGGWVIERIRTDKKTPNDHKIAEKVMTSIDEGIQFNQLLREFSKLKKRQTKSSCKAYGLPIHYNEFYH